MSAVLEDEAGDVIVQIALLDCRRADISDALARHRPMTDFERDLERRSELGRLGKRS